MNKKLIPSNYTSKLLICIVLVFIYSSFSLDRTDYRDGMYKNVCKELRNNVLVYFIFVDSKETCPWTEFDIQSTIDSMAIAIQWIEEQARKQNINLNIKNDYYIGQTYSTIKRKLPQKSVLESLYMPNLKQGLTNLNIWADKIAREAGSSYQPEKKDGIPDQEQPRNKERLIAYLRDKYEVESVCLLYMVNNYFKEDISIPVNTMNADDIEFGIVSYKYPSEIAHNILHLFGAADLYETPFRKNKSKIQFAHKNFPKDIMQDPYSKKINNCQIGEFTSYLIGWKSNLNAFYKELLRDNINSGI